MKTKVISCIFALAVCGSCFNSGSGQSESADSASGIIVPDVVMKGNPEIMQFLYNNELSLLKASADGKPLVFTADSLDIENPEGVRHLERSYRFYRLFKKGEGYYDDETDTRKTADKDTLININKISGVTLIPVESYDFDSEGRLTKYIFENFVDDELVATFDYRPDGSFSYEIELQDNGNYPKGKVHGSWDGSVWKEEVIDWDYDKDRFMPGISYTLEKLPDHPGFFCVKSAKGNKIEDILYRRHDGCLISELTPGEEIPSEQLTINNDVGEITRKDIDCHGNALYQRYGSESQTEIFSKISYQ